MLSTGCFPCYNLYPTKDGKYITVGALEDKFWINLCKVLNREDLIKYKDVKGEHAKRVKKELESIFIKRNRSEWIDFFKDKEVCVEPVNEVEDLLKDPHISYRKIIRDGKYVKLPINFSGNDCSIKYPPPKLGEHNREVLNSLGYDDNYIEELKNKGVI